MKDFIDALFHYSQETQVSRYLRTPEYRQAIHGLEKDWEDFRAALTEEQGHALDALLSRNDKVQRLEEEAAFCSALSIGLDLGRL